MLDAISKHISIKLQLINNLRQQNNIDNNILYFLYHISNFNFFFFAFIHYINKIKENKKKTEIITFLLYSEYAE